jgi:hypothetical protein
VVRRRAYRGGVSVVARDARRRWLLVGAGVVALCLVPAVVAVLPARAGRADPVRLRAAVLASAAVPFQGYVDVQARMDVPDLPDLGEVAGLFGGTTRLRAWYASAQAWRVAVLEPTGERDIYRTARGTYQWDFERNLVTEVVGDVPVRLPWAADLLPPDLARWLLAAAGDESVTAIGTRRVAGVAADGLRLRPTDADTTVGQVDVWADPKTGLPLQVEVTDRGGRTPLIRSRFVEVSRSRPGADALRPPQPASAGFATTSEPDVLSGIASAVAAFGMPPGLGGRPRMPSADGLFSVGGVAGYGTGLSRFVVIALPRGYGQRTLQAAEGAGGAPVRFDGGHGFEIAVPLLSMLVVRRDGDRPGRRTFLLAGTVTPAVLRQAGGELSRLEAGPG